MDIIPGIHMHVFDKGNLIPCYGKDIAVPECADDAAEKKQDVYHDGKFPPL